MHVGGPVARAPAAGGGEQPAPGQDPAGVVHQRGKHGGLGGGQGREARCGVMGCRRFGQHLADEGDELAGAERAGQPAAAARRVAPDGQAAGPGGHGVGDQEDDRRAQGPADASGVQAGPSLARSWAM